MATDAGDVAGLAGGTLSGAAAGSVLGPGGAVIGGAIGFISGLFSNSAESAAEKLAATQIEREKIAAGLSGEARELQLVLNSFEVDRARKSYVARAISSGEAVSAAAVASGLKGSSVAANARSTILQQTASNLQASYFSEAAGKGISELLQQATNAQLGINGPKTQQQQAVSQLTQGGLSDKDFTALNNSGNAPSNGFIDIDFSKLKIDIPA